MDTSVLTPQQQRVLRELMTGDMYKVIGFRMGVSERTVRRHVDDITQRLGLPYRTKLVATCMNLKVDMLKATLEDIAENRASDPRTAAFRTLHAVDILRF